jgi:hypothetical protein
MIAPPKPPAPDELEALIKEARERQLRRRLLGAAAVAIVTATGLGIYALAIGGSPGHSPEYSSPSGSVAVSACRPSQLATVLIFDGALGLGGASGAATIRNTSGTTCRLPGGAPPVVTISWRGKLRPLHQVALRPPDQRPVHLLRPDAKAAIWLVWENWCASPHQPITRGGYPLVQPRVTFSFRLGKGLTITAPYVGAPTCLNPQAPSYLMASRPVTS